MINISLSAIKKDHFPLPFLDQVLERVARQDYYCFLDDTCSFGTYAYRYMPFGFCNAFVTFKGECLASSMTW